MFTNIGPAGMGAMGAGLAMLPMGLLGPDLLSVRVGLKAPSEQAQKTQEPIPDEQTWQKRGSMSLNLIQRAWATVLLLVVLARA